MLDNRRAVSLFSGMVSAAGYSLPLAVVTGFLSDAALQSGSPALFNAAAVFSVSFVLTGTAYVHWLAAVKIAWNIAHAPQPVNVTVQGGGTDERMIPELDASGRPIYHKPTSANVSAFATEAAVRAIEPRALVNPRIPNFITVTQATALAYGALAGQRMTIREWAGKGKPFSDPQWRQLREWMIRRGFWACADDRPNSKIMMTDTGRAWMKDIATAFPPPLKTYRYKA